MLVNGVLYPLAHVERYYVHELSRNEITLSVALWLVLCILVLEFYTALNSVMVGLVHSSSCVLHRTQESYPLKSPPKILNAELKFE